MHVLRRFGIYAIIVSVLYAVYQDLTTSHTPAEHSNEVIREEINFQVKQIKVQPGDTVLSIMEKLHENFDSMQIEQIMHDFQLLNPNADPYSLKEGTLYYFPYYD